MSSSRNVYLVDDEPELTRALTRLLEAEGFVVRAFDSGDDFLRQVSNGDAACVVLDVAMPGLDGLRLQQHLAAMPGLAIVFLTGHGDIPMSVQAIKAGAVDFLTKPVKRADLLRAVGSGLERAQAMHSAMKAHADLHARLALLTPREREVLGHVISGRLNKIIADRLGTTEHTIKVHRGRVMEKLAVGSVAELVRFAQQAGIAPES
ncbi:MAG: response regulator transcription factor [Burkholderiales bacterium]|nr:response regulator transcription factor [Burkholderiales bacterium]